MSEEKLSVLVCGSNHAAHVLVGLASSTKRVDCRVLVLDEGDADKWSKAVRSTDFILQTTNDEGEPVELKGIPSKVTKKAGDVVSSSNIIFLTMASPDDQEYLTAIEPHIKANTIVVGVPAQPGFAFNCYDALGATSDRIALVFFQVMPWACRTIEFGKKVKITAPKEQIEAVSITRRSSPKADPVGSIQRIFGELPHIEVAKNYMGPLLTFKNNINPVVMYGMWSAWNGTALDDIPSFFKEISSETVDAVKDYNKEVLKLVKKLSSKNSFDLSKVVDIHAQYVAEYEDMIMDPSTLETTLKTNRALASIKHPMKCNADEKFVPDYSHIFLSEDIPFGLLVVKGIADLAQVDTPTINGVIKWAQKVMGKEYLTDKGLTGKDISETHAPQRYGYKKLEDLFKIV